MKYSLLNAAIISALLPFSAAAAEQVNNESGDAKNNAEEDKYLERIQILGTSDKLRTQGGAATLIDELDLEKFEFDDIGRVLANVPGVNIRQEDGYGLRPNIGFRGATPERSKKISLMEDGVLIAPAPYSAPSAYYFPMVNRMTAVEVFKGPAAIKYGPNTVAGALNLVTRQIPDDFEMGIDLAYGADGYKKAHAYHGETEGKLGYLVEGIFTEADGFKDIDNAQNKDLNSGFEKTDLMAKVNYDLSTADYQQFIEFKGSKATETSNETYLGLTDADFAKNPYRRYAASQAGLMDWDHSTLQLTHFIAKGELDFTTRLYQHKFARAWQKLAGIKDGPSLLKVISNPEGIVPEGADDAEEDALLQYPNYYKVLTGQEDGELIVGTNDRAYLSQGLQTDLGYKLVTGDLQHKIEAGLRFHHDEIDRDHFKQTYLMINGDMSLPSSSKDFTSVNTEESDTVSLYLQDTITYQDLTLTAGIRGEYIDSYYVNRAEGQTENWLEKNTQIWLPSISAFYKLNEDMGIFAGVHQGFVPSSPQQDNANVDAEKSVNYELGFRMASQDINMEVVGFFNDYENLKEGCSFSVSSTCPLDSEFDGGNVDVYGLEANIKHTLELTDNISLPWSLTYSYTDSEFKHSFDSDFALWGDVEEGDKVPYLADHQLTFIIGLAAEQWQCNLLTRYTGEMQEVAGSGENLSDSVIEAHTIVDFSASYDLSDQHSLYTKLDNITDKAVIVSHRPDGARPGKPRMWQVGYKFKF